MSPRVSILVPCYNEAGTIGHLLQAICQQDFLLNELEVVVADGRSTDGTREAILAFGREHPELPLRVIDNPARSIPAALNRAWRAAEGEILVRLDAHCVPRQDYVSRCVTALQTTSAANVGGLWLIEAGADTWLARSIAAAAADPLGAGDARYRTGGAPGPVDTVPFGAFRRQWLERVGGYDESLLTNEDYDLNWRLRQVGGVIWFDPSIRCVYFARSRLRDLARQYSRYGFWKARMLLRHPNSLRWRQAIPAAFVLGTLTLLLLGLWLPTAWAVLSAGWLFYLLVLLGRGFLLAWGKRRPSLVLGLPLSLSVIHLAWGSAFLVGLVSGLSTHAGNGS